MIHIPDSVRELQPYLPGKPIEETQREFGLKKVIKLASNENPIGPSPRAVAAIKKALKESHRYPDAAGTELKNALRKFHSLEGRFSIAIGNGSNELIDLLIRTLCVPGDAIVTSKAAFVAYKICAQAFGVRVREAAIGSDLLINLDAVLAEVRSDDRANLVFLPNPNNPTGTYLPEGKLRSFLAEIAQVRKGSVVVVLDDAYAEFVRAADRPDAIELLRDFPANVVVARTFSKVYGLAGLRVGYLLGESAVLQYLERVRNPFNVSSAATAGALAALADRAHLKRSLKNNTTGMRFWERELTKLGVPFWPSQGNFLLIDTQKGFGVPGIHIFHSCLQRGVIFRPVANYGLDHALRITVGTMAENRFALKALKALKKESLKAKK